MAEQRPQVADSAPGTWTAAQLARMDFDFKHALVEALKAGRESAGVITATVRSGSA